MKGPQEIAGLLASRSLGKTSRMAPPIRGWVLSRSWENDCCCQRGDSFPHGVTPHRTPDLSEEDARIGWKQKALLIFTCSHWSTKEKLTTDQLSMSGINFLIKRSFAPSSPRMSCLPGL